MAEQRRGPGDEKESEDRRSGAVLDEVRRDGIPAPEGSLDVRAQRPVSEQTGEPRGWATVAPQPGQRGNAFERPSERISQNSLSCFVSGGAFWGSLGKADFGVEGPRLVRECPSGQEGTLL